MWQIVINGPGYFDTSFDLREGSATLGRAEENDIVLSGDLVSRRHARFHVKGELLQVEDLGSRNGTRLNGRQLTGLADVALGDTVTVGDNTLAVRQPSREESVRTDQMVGGSGPVRVVESGRSMGPVVVSKDVRESLVLAALDNVVPFEFSNPFAEEGDGGGAAHGSGPKPALPQAGSVLLLYKLSEMLAQSRTLQEFLDGVADRLVERLGASTTVVMMRHGDGVMVPAAVRHSARLQRGEVPVSDAIVDEALRKGAALAIADVRDDARFGGRESVLIYAGDHVVCVPVGQAPYKGVLYLTVTGVQREALEQLVDLCTAVSHLVSTAVDKYEREQAPASERLRRALERFHPPEVVEKRATELLAAGPPKPNLLEGKEATVLSVELLGFTAWQPTAPPEAVTELLSDLQQRVAGIVFSFDGTVASLCGETALCLFGAPYGRPDDAVRAVRAGLALQAHWDRRMAKHPAGGQLRLRVGISSGKVQAGTVGFDTRLEYAVVGEAVTAAAALRQAAKPGQVLIGETTFAHVGQRFDCDPAGHVALPSGRKQAGYVVLEEDMAALTSPGMAIR
ncbi:MAG: FHA domain-containing protein [Deltaproteobacteria bacterium]|nr:FHA domain-containing protein [Deltaproteobacteria bacterium]